MLSLFTRQNLELPAEEIKSEMARKYRNPLTNFGCRTILLKVLSRIKFMTLFFEFVPREIYANEK